MRLAFTAAAMLVSSSAASQQLPPCAPAGAEICKLMSQPQFGAAYSKAYDEKLQPDDAVYEISDSLRSAVVGVGAAGPAGIGKQLDAALDHALGHMKQRICGANQGKAAAEVTTAVAEGLATAGRRMGVSLSAEMVGGMTGSLVSSIKRRGASCLCGAADFSAIRKAC